MINLLPTAMFFVGGAVGGAITWCALKSMYSKQSDEEISSVKEAFHIREEKLKSEISILKKRAESEQDVSEKNQTILSNEKIKEKDNILSYTRGKYMQYVPSATSEKNEEIEPTNEHANNATHVIPPEEYDELGYSLVSLTYYADGILADENGVIVDDIEEMIGDAIDHFGEYEDDSVYCRNDVKRCDYEILKDLRRYADVRKSFPRNL